ncbi:MAG: 50S ribosomal protein L9 [Devosiaceae bacterium]|nr:50S ribosomal protein L9 [Devosiaceae bacterium MH13]
MDVILLERVAKLGQMGETVKVKDGYARNFLLPTGKALRATKTNLAKFEAERAQLEARNLERKQEAESVASQLEGTSYIIIRSAGETGQLYGSVAARDIAEVATDGGVSVSRAQVRLDRAIKTIGLHEVLIQLHPEVEVSVTVNVARSEDEAERQAAGEDLTVQDYDGFEFDEDLEDDLESNAEEVFEEVPEELTEGEEAAETDEEEDA